MLGIFSLTTCGVGVTLSPEIDEIVIAELHWTPALMGQAEDRVHRVNTERPVDCHYLVAEGSFDEDVFAILGNKARTNALVMDNAPSAFTFADPPTQ
jgi:SWI/SNF-related matrix-associated actin-dependent regulator 1 of chromatin subfamily A